MAADSRAIRIVVRIASMIWRLENSRAYQSSVKPSHTTLERELLNDSTIMTRIGAYRNIMVSAR